MIFNPLFIGENGATQSLIPKSGKLANNKYLFSDIVKVVMNPSKKGSGKPSLNLDSVNNELKLGFESEQKLIQLKYRLLTDEHSEQVKAELADILPADIAQLLVSEELVTTSEKAVSYISKEPLKGELQNFLNNLIGAEIIEQNINQKSGLLLNLEDQKSAINIELVEDGRGKSASDKIIVQTLVVPEKSKLLSMFGNGKNSEILFRTSGNSADQLFLSSNELKLTNGQSEIIRPTLSVYSFSRDGNHFESLTKSLRSNEAFKHNLDLLKNSNDKSNLTASKSNLEKISFIPSELKNSHINSDELKTKSSPNKVNTDLKLVTQNEVKRETDYSVSKITIVKKQDENSVLTSLKNRSELSSKEFESALRRIDFNKKIDGQKPNLQVINNTQDKNSSISPNKIFDSNTKNTFDQFSIKTNKNIGIKLSEQTSSKSEKQETDIDLVTNKLKVEKQALKESNQPASKINLETEKSPDSKIKETNIETKKESTKFDTKFVQQEKLNIDLKTSKSENSIPLTNTDDKKTEISNPAKTEMKTQLENEVKQSSDGKNLSEKSSSEIKTTKTENLLNDTTKIFDKNESKANLKTDIKNNAENSNNELTLKSNVSSKDNSELKTELRNNIADQEKSSTADQVKKVHEKDNPQVSKENQEIKIASQNAVNSSVENREANDNRKFSVKVKSGIKSVSDKNDSIKNSMEDKPLNNNSANGEGSKAENGESNQTQNSSLQKGQFEMKQHVETNFQQTLNKSEIGHINSADSKTVYSEPNTESRIIKSVELIKGISEFISKQEKGSLSFDIRPEHLGKMKITLDTVDNMLKANIEVETEQAKHLVEKNIDKLQQQLSNNGLQLNSLNISLSYSKQQRDGKKINNKSENDSENLGQVGEAEEEKSKKHLGYNTYEYIA